MKLTIRAAIVMQLGLEDLALTASGTMGGMKMHTLWRACRLKGTASAGRTACRKLALGAIAALGLGGSIALSPADAQQPTLMQQGSAAVTGFSGFVAYPAPEGADPFAYVTLNTDGAVATIVDLTSLGAKGEPSQATKTFSVSAAHLGQVFGVTTDTTPKRNVYLAATSAYGLSLFVVDESGNLKRVQQGEPGAQLVPGQFGAPELGGGPGSIWRVAGDTGEISLFANIDAGVGSLAALGGLAYHPGSQQIFAAERSTGIIYRIGLNGQVRGKYDHGIEGRPGSGFAPIPMTPPPPADISSPAFDTANPATWGFAPPARRVLALAVHNNRLYYSIAQGPQIWSASITASGAIPGRDARMEVEIPSLQEGVEIASITFDPQGRMYVAERAATTGDFYLTQVARPGQARVLRYTQKAPNDPNPGLWRLMPEQYSVGLAPAHANANGGVAIGYGYDDSGNINGGACGATVWSTGERLLDPGDGSEEFTVLDGLQGNLTSLVQPQNTPPANAWFVDFDDQYGDPNLRGYMGAISTLPCPAPAAAPPPPSASCPAGTYFSNGQCLIYPTCPPGTTFLNGQCVYPQCPPGFIVQGNQCVPPPVTCPPGMFIQNGQCLPLACPPGLTQTPDGYCVCPTGTIFANGMCQPPNYCPPGAFNIGGICLCPPGLTLQNGQCKPFTCPPGQVMNFAGQCKPIICPPGQHVQGDKCVAIPCPPGQETYNGKCVAQCPPGQHHTMPNGVCKPFLPPVFCLPGQEMFNGKCVARCGENQIRLPNGACVNRPILTPPKPPILCLPGQEMFNGKCVARCSENQIRLPNGACINRPVLTPPKPPVQDPPIIRRPPVTKPPVINPPVIQRPPVINPPVIQQPPVIKPPVIRRPPPVEAPPVVELPRQPPVIQLPGNRGGQGDRCPRGQIRNDNGECVPRLLRQPERQIQQPQQLREQLQIRPQLRARPDG